MIKDDYEQTKFKLNFLELNENKLQIHTFL